MPSRHFQVWFWLELQKKAIVREVKRLEVQGRVHISFDLEASSVRR